MLKTLPLTIAGLGLILWLAWDLLERVKPALAALFRGAA